MTKRTDGKPGTLETAFSTAVHTFEKTWGHHETFRGMFRDAAGTIERVFNTQSVGGKVEGVLEAKLTQDGSYRLKRTHGDKSESFNVIPTERFSSGLWSAPGFLALSKGTKMQVWYAWLTTNSDDEPIFGYSTLTRATPGVLLEDSSDFASKPNPTPRAPS